MSTGTVTIDRLGAQGDGVARTEAGPVFAPFTLPGETVSLAVNKANGTLISLKEASPERVEPPCRHFGPDGVNGTCGGCTLQHASDALYHAFKRNLVIDALRSKGLTPEVGALIIARPGDRRRAAFTARRTEKELLLGYNQMQSHHIVSIGECPITSPGIVSRLATIRKIAAAMASSAEPFRITVLETDTGLDLAFEGLKLSDPDRKSVV